MSVGFFEDGGSEQTGATQRPGSTQSRSEAVFSSSGVGPASSEVPTPREGDMVTFDKDLLRPRVSIVVPAYNEVENMPDLFAELKATFEKFAFDGELVLVDDGSSDGTYEVARTVAAELGFEPVRILRHQVNRGKTEALLTGAKSAQGELLVFFDADLQHATDEIPRFVNKLDEGFDLVAGRKLGVYDKRLVSSIYNWLARIIFRVPVRDLNAMKALRASVLDRVTLRHDWHRYLVVLVHAQGFRMGEIDVTLHPRRHGEPKYSGKSRILVGMLDLISVWFQLFFGRKPMLFFGVTGLALLISGAVTGLVALVLRFGFAVGFRPLLTLVVLLVVSGLLLFVLGFLAEMIAGLRGEIEELKRNQEELRQPESSLRKD